MKKYKKFLIITLTLIIISTCLVSILIVFVGEFFVGQKKLITIESAYINQWTNKKTEIGQELDKRGPKLVILSGSNSLYGIDAEKIEKETGIQTLNLATHAGLGPYIFYEAKKNIKKHDTVILPLEYSYYADEVYAHKLTATNIEYIIAYDSNYYRQLPFLDKLKVITYINQLSFFRNLIKRPDELPCHLNNRGSYNYNISSDVQYSKTTKPDPIIVEKLPKNYKNWELYEFIQWCKDNEIKVFAFAPNFYHKRLITEDEKKSFDQIRKFYKLAGVKFVGDFEDGFFDLEYMRDTNYHLNQDGQKIRTDYFIQKIKEITHK